jgi:GNAT superfamily N-acetyltransferase
MSMTRTDPTILFLNRMDRYRTTGDAWMFFVKRYYHVPGIAARFALTPIDWRVVHITDLKANFPGAGEGTRLMRVIADLADDTRVVLSLDARSFGEITIPDDRLIDWYGRFGFRETVSDTLESGMPMARFPA